MTVSPKQLGKVQAISNMATGGTIVVTGRIEQYRALTVNQTTASQSLILPDPIDTDIIFSIEVLNVGSAAFTIGGKSLSPDTVAKFSWNGSAWVVEAAAAGITDWVTATAYTVGQYVEDSRKLYKVIVAHTSDTSIDLDVAVDNLVEVSRAFDDWSFAANNDVALVLNSYILTPGNTINMPVAPSNGDAVRFATLTEWAVANITFVAPGATTVADGQVGVLAGYDVVEMVYDSVTDNWVALLGGSAAPDVAVPMDASTAALPITLPAATGTGTIKRYVIKDKTNAITFGVQVGEYLNEVINTTYLASNHGVGTYFELVDYAAGKWSLQIVGASTSTSLVNGSTYLAANTNGTGAAQTLVSFTLPAAGTYEVNYFASMATGSASGENTLFLATSAAIVVPNTERVGDYNNAGQGRGTISGTHTLTVGAATTFLLRGDVGSSATYRNDSSGRTGVIWRQLPSTETVLAGHVVPTALSYAQFSLAANQTTNLGDGNHVMLNVVDHSTGTKISLDTSTAYTTAANSASIGRFTLQPGLYEVSHSLAMSMAGQGWASFGLWDVDANAMAGATSGGGTGNSGVESSSATSILSVTSAKRFEIRVFFANAINNIWSNTANVGGRSKVVIKELPSGTVVNPDTVPVTQLSRIQANLTATANLSLNSDVAFNAIAFNGGIAMTSGVFSLLAGKTYLLKADLLIQSVASSNPEFAWVNSTTNAELIPNVGRASSRVSSQSTLSEGKSTAEIIYMPAADMTVKLRWVAGGSTAQVEHTSSTAIIEELPTATVIDPGAVNVNDQAANGYYDIGTVRHMWGTHVHAGGSTQTVTMPAAFANTLYSVVGSPGVPGQDLMVSDVLRTSASAFTFLPRASTGAAFTTAGGNYYWQAVGLKP